MQHLEAAIMDQLGWSGKYLIAGSTGPPFLGMLTNSSPPVKNAKKLERPLAKGMRCPNNLSYSAKSLMFGVSTLWGPFLVSNGYSYILLAVDYVSRWVEAIATKTNDAKVVVDFVKSNIFCRFGVLKALISDQGSHFCDRSMSFLLHKYGVVHRITIAYHPHINGQAEVFNREIKMILQKMTNPSRKDWSRLLEDALWAYRTAYRTPLGMSPYRIVFEKACHLPLQELDELRLEAYENSRIYKQKVKRFHDQQILRKEFQVGQKVLLFNSCLKLITGKLHSRWDGPFVIINVFPYGAAKLKDEHTNNSFQVNGHQIKLFHEGLAPIAGDMETISLIDMALPDDTP
ncbi:gag-pol, partial [Mucuna pruriens]